MWRDRWSPGISGVKQFLPVALDGGVASLHRVLIEVKILLLATGSLILVV